MNKKKLQLSWRFRWAHHPLCERYSNSVWKIGPLYLCQGCTLLYSGIFIGIILSFLSSLSLEAQTWIFLAFTGIIISIIGESNIFNYRPAKRIIRLTMGLFLGIFLWFILSFPNFFFKLIGLVVTYASYRFYGYIRSTKLPAKDKCHGCKEVDTGTVCYGLELEAQATREYNNFLTELYEPRIRKQYEQKYRQKMDRKMRQHGEEGVLNLNSEL